jgi:hypothetical protein
METLNKDRWFALVMGVNNAKRFIMKYNKIMARLIELEKQYKTTDPGFEMSTMWTCSSSNGQVKFRLTPYCIDHILQSKILDIFKSEQF